VRTLRAHSARVPFRRRSLVREGRSLTGVVPDLVVHADSSWPALTVLLPGPPLGSSPEPELSREPDALVRMLGTALGSLARWEEAGLGIDGLSGDEICDGAGGLVIVCLSPSEPGDAGAGIARVARALDSWWDEGGESPVDDLLGGLATFPPRSAREAVDRWSHALADHLVGLHHALARRHRGLVHEERASRLAVQVERLVRAVAPPQGRGAVGVDLEGRTLVVEGRAQALCWGPAGTPLAAVCEPRGRLDARQARRLLRARATAPLKPHLQEAVGGQAAFVEAACRWVAARLSLRTVRLLLEATR